MQILYRESARSGRYNQPFATRSLGGGRPSRDLGDTSLRTGGKGVGRRTFRLRATERRILPGIPRFPALIEFVPEYTPVSERVILGWHQGPFQPQTLSNYFFRLRPYGPLVTAAMFSRHGWRALHPRVRIIKRRGPIAIFPPLAKSPACLPPPVHPVTSIAAHALKQANQAWLP